MEAVEQLLDIFNWQAKNKEDNAARQRVLKDVALTQLVQI